jgi:hypothetical protein
MPEQKMYMELDLSAMKQDMQNNLYDPDVRTEKEFLGSETVDGHPAKKYHVTIIKQGKKETGGFLWEATDLNNFPVKYQSEDGKTTTVWKNIKRGPIADSLFEVPSGYKKMELNIPGMGRMKIPGR